MPAQIIPVWFDVRNGNSQTRTVQFPEPVDIIATAAVNGQGGNDVFEIGFSGIVQAGAFRRLGEPGLLGSLHSGLVETGVTEVRMEANCWKEGWLNGVCTIFAYPLGTKDADGIDRFTVR